jgi:Na+-driven multidrug efflux pump
MSGKFLIQLRIDKLRVDLSSLKSLLRLGLPSGMQNSLISIANLVVQSNINAFGDQAMAGCGCFSKLEGFVFLPIISLTMALTTFVGQNLGAGELERCKKGARTGIIMAVATAELIGIGFWIFAPQLVGLFSSSPGVIAHGVRQARTEALFFFLLAFAHAAAAVLRGAGKTLSSMLILLSCWCVLRIIYITLMVRLIPDITVIFTAYPLTWGLSCLCFAWCLRGGKWLNYGKHSKL